MSNVWTSQEISYKSNETPTFLLTENRQLGGSFEHQQRILYQTGERESDNSLDHILLTTFMKEDWNCNFRVEEHLTFLRIINYRLSFLRLGSEI